jgi:hypothetical protein
MGKSLLDWQRELKTPVAGKNNLENCQKKEIPPKSAKETTLYDYITHSKPIKYPALFNGTFDEGDFKVALMMWKIKNGITFP